MNKDIKVTSINHLKPNVMKTLFANNATKSFDNFAFDVLTVEELACIKGGKEDDEYIDPMKIQ